MGQTSAALSLLHDVISNRRNRSAPLPVLEPIMLRLVSLCVTLRRGKVAKDALYLYKNMTQNLTVATIEVLKCAVLVPCSSSVITQSKRPL